MNYGACRLAVRAKSIKKFNISFNDCFGGGNIYSCGEDSLFIYEMLKKHLKIYVHPYILGYAKQDTSTWFTGYNEKFLYDKGAFFCALSRKNAKLLCLQLLLRHKEMYKDANLNFMQAYKLMCNGIKGYDGLERYK